MILQEELIDQHLNQRRTNLLVNCSKPRIEGCGDEGGESFHTAIHNVLGVNEGCHHIVDDLTVVA
jgi:hypothetical protein